LVGMIAGSLLPQWVGDVKGRVHHYEGSGSGNADAPSVASAA